MKRKTAKLVLAKEAIRQLAVPDIKHVIGGDAEPHGSLNCTRTLTGCQTR